jgi:gliding motility-associated-like protein
MKNIFAVLAAIAVFAPFPLMAQQGVHGPKTVSAANTIVNEYTDLTATTFAGATSLPVSNSALNSNSRFATSLQPGDLVMIIQMQGVVANGQFDVGATDTTFGKITSEPNYYSCGRYEFHQVVSVPNATTINIDCGLTYSYILGAAGRTCQVIRVPRYTTLTINSGGVLTCDDWNGTVGGVLVTEVQGNLVINAGGSIDATGKGFRGGSLVGDNVTSYGVNTTYSTNNALGAEKGEGVGGYQVAYDNLGGRYCRAPVANGGGGGDGHNGGGGGGANAPNSTSATAYWSGNGIPDPTAAYTAAWNLEPPINTMSLRTSANSAGGGRGGYTFSGNNQNATTTGPGNAAWGGDSRNHQATGLGGRPLDYTTGRIFMGGGGGAGDQNNSGGGAGGDGGGLIYLMVFGNVSGSGTIVSNGNSGGNGQGGTGVITGIDGGGGGGAGGTVIVNCVGTVANTFSITTNGGAGGNQVINTPLLTSEGEGPGGGGGGGYIAVSNGTPTRTSNGGNNGTTNSSALTEFPPNGATRGCPGTNNASITNFNITTTNVTICTGNSTSLTAVLSGTVPGGTVVNWYNASVGGSPIFTGTTYTTPVLTAGTYTYWVGTCPGWWRVPVTVTVVATPTVTATASSGTICSGNSTTLTAGGASTYTWMPGSLSGTSVTVSPTTTTTYTVTGTAVGGCSSTAQVTVTVNPTPTVTATAGSATICSGNSTTLTGSGAASYTWNPGALTGSPVTVSPTTTTTYTVTGTSSGCSSTAQVTVTVNPTPTVIATAASPTICSGNSTTLTGSGATSYTWNPGALSGSPVTVSPATTTTYTVTGTSSGCSSTAQVTVTVNPTPTVTATAGSSTICAGSSTTLTGSGATSYTWNPGALTGSPVTVTPAVTTTYTVTGTSSGCSSTAQVTVTVNPTPTVTATVGSATICSGSSTTLTGSGATSYTWNPGALTGSPVTVSPATTTTYTVTGTGANGCTSTAQVTVTVNPSPTVTATAASPTICNGGNTTLTGSGATSYTWNPGALTGSPVTVSPTTTTTYTVAGTAANGCTSTAQVTVTVLPSPTVTATASSTTICSGGSTTLTGSGATTYTWNPGSLTGTSVTVSPTTTTTYTVSGSNGGCSSTAQVTITVNPSPTVTATSSNAAICNGGSATLTGSGASSYTWNPGALSGTSVTVSPTTTTTYTVTGTGVNSCTSTAQVTVTVNALPTVTATATNASVCPGNTSDLTGSGAVSYTWNPGSLSGSPVTVSPASTTTYTVTGTDANGCANTGQVTVTVNPTPTVTAAATSASICIGSTTDLTGSGASTYSWMPGSLSGSPVTVSPSATTTYTVTGTDGNGCTSTGQVTVTVNPLPVPVVTAAPDSICPGQTATLTASGGTNYFWNGGSLVNASGASQTDAPAASTMYYVSVTDANGCSANDSVQVIVNPLPVANAGTDQTVCAGTAVSLNATGGTSYVWNGGSLSNASGQSQSDTPGTSTSYVVTVTDANGCSLNDTILVNVNALPIVDAGMNVSICPTSTTQLNATGATSYVWTPALTLSDDSIANPVASPTATTTYIVSGTDANGCSSVDSVTVTIGNNLSVFAGPDLTICSGDTVQLSTSGGVTYSWSPSATLDAPNSATTNAFPSSTTTYIVHVTDAANCQGQDTVTVNVTGPVALSVSGSTTICIGQSASISATPSNGNAPYTFTWSNSLTGGSPQTVSPVVTTTYSVSATDSLGCTSPVQTITVNVNPPLNVTNVTNATICAGDTASLTATASGGDGNFSYSWLPGNLSGATVSVNPATTTTYSVIVADGCGTQPDTMTTTVTISPAPVVTVTSNVVNGCGPLCVNFTGQSTGNCSSSSWDFGDGNTSTSQNPTNCFATPGTYDVTYTCTDANGCSGSVVMANMIQVFPNPTAEFTSSALYNTVTVSPGTPVDVCFTDQSVGAVAWDWSFTTVSNQQNPCFTISDTGFYCAQLAIVDANGCRDTAFHCIVALSEVQYSIPNVFTPNGDGTNDYFIITATGLRDFHCEIYDRWGVLIAEWNDAAGGWDGHTTSGMEATDGVYYYIMRLTDYSDKVTEEKGFVHLIRGGN